MSSFCSLNAVSAAVYAALNVGALTALAPGGVWDALPQNPTFPCVLFEVREDQQRGGFGSKPGTRMLPEVGVDVHVFSQHAGLKEAQQVMAKVLDLLKDPPTVSGYSSWAIFHDRTLPFGDEIVGGVRTKELVAQLRLYVEET